MSDFSSSNSSSIIPFICSLSFKNVLYSLSFASLSLSDTYSSLILCYVIWISSFSLLLTVCFSPSALGCFSLFHLNHYCYILVPILVFFFIHIHFVPIHSFCVIFCIIQRSKSNIFLYLIKSINRYFRLLKCSSTGLSINLHLYVFSSIYSSLL